MYLFLDKNDSVDYELYTVDEVLVESIITNIVDGTKNGFMKAINFMKTQIKKLGWFIAKQALKVVVAILVKLKVMEDTTFVAKLGTRILTGPIGDLVIENIKMVNPTPGMSIYDMVIKELEGVNSEVTRLNLKNRVALDEHISIEMMMHNVVQSCKSGGRALPSAIKTTLDNMKNAYNVISKELVFVERAMDVLSDAVRDAVETGKNNIAIGTAGSMPLPNGVLIGRNGKLIDTNILTITTSKFNMLSMGAKTINNFGRDIKRTLDAGAFVKTVNSMD